jgi:hypothetical protein
MYQEKKIEHQQSEIRGHGDLGAAFGRNQN